MAVVLSLLAAIVTIYTILCFINIIISWLPGVKFTSFGKIISSLTDPYMNFFSRTKFLRIGRIDFSPIVSIGLLTLISSVLAGIQSTGRIYFGGILATVIYMIWNIASSLIVIFFLAVVIRWITLLINKGNAPYDSPWAQIDSFLQNVSNKVANTFSKNRFTTTYKKSLLITWISLLAILLAGNFLVRLLLELCRRIPF